MEIDNVDETFVSMEIQIWNNKDSNGMFLYNNNLNEFKKVYFNFDKTEKDSFLIKTKDNYIQIIKKHTDFKEGRGDILFRIRRSFKFNIYEVMNPPLKQKNFTNDNDIFLNNKIWFSVKSPSYFGGNRLNYNLNENDIIKLGKQKFIIAKIHFAYDNGKENIIDENFYKNNNISYVSIINKESKPIFNNDIKHDRYRIRNNKSIIIEKLNEEKVNEVEGINIKESKNINQKTNEIFKDTNYNSINIQNAINNLDNNISTNNASSQNNGKNGKNNYQKSSAAISTYGHSNDQNENGNENESSSDNESENENDKCWLCLNSNCDEDNPLICLCNCHNFIHYECLKMYLNSKIIVTINNKNTVTTYTCDKFNCDMCLKPYQLRFRIPELNRTYELMNLNLPEEVDYICLESLNYITNNNNNIKKVHIVQLRDEEIIIGRNHYNDIISNDNSVSRDHAVLKYNKYNKSLFLENTNGRYGTLVLVRGNIKITEEKTYFQILNTHISMVLAKKRDFNKIGNESLEMEPFNIIYERDNNNYNYNYNYNDNDSQC